jgi:hypothetical protein
MDFYSTFFSFLISRCLESLCESPSILKVYNQPLLCNSMSKTGYVLKICIVFLHVYMCSRHIFNAIKK